MSITIDATISGPASNSYLANADADALMEARQPNTVWTASMTFEDDQNRALAAACVLLDGQRWKGYRATSAQALAWPRIYVPDPDPASGGLYYLTETAIPLAIRRAQAELAYLLLSGDYDPGPSGLDGIASVKVGAIEVTADAGHSHPSLPDSVRRLIAAYLEVGGGSVRLVRG